MDERRRHELFEGLAATLGPDQATTMFDLLPPPGADVATRDDLAQLEARMNARFDEFEHRFERLEDRFDGLDQRFDGLDQRFDDRTERLRAELLAAFRGELVTAVSGQTRAVVTATIATALSVTAGIATLAQLL